MKTIRKGAALGLVLALVAGVPAALAQERTTDTTVASRDDLRPIDDLKKRALELIAYQMAVLERLDTKIENSRFISEGHAGRLEGDIAGVKAELRRIAEAVGEAETVEEVWALIREVHSLHVGQVYVPKVHQVIASDALVTIGGKLDRFADRLGELLQRAEEAGYDVTAGWELLEEMERLIAAGVELADPVAESVIGLDGDDWPDPAEGLLSAGRRNLHEAGQDLRQAYGKGHEIVAFLRSLSD